MSASSGYAKGYPGQDLYFRPHEYTDNQAFYECKSTVCEREYPLFVDDIAEDKAPKVQLSILWFKGIGEGADKFKRLLDSFSRNVNCDFLWVDVPEIDDYCLTKFLGVIESTKTRCVTYGLVSVKWKSNQFRLFVEKTMSIYATKVNTRNTNDLSRVHVEVDADVSKEDVEFLIEAALKHKSRLCFELTSRFIDPIDHGLAKKRHLEISTCNTLIDAFYERSSSVLFITDWPRAFSCRKLCHKRRSNTHCKCDDCTTVCGQPSCLRCKVSLLIKRNFDMRWSNVHPLVLNVCISLVAMRLPPYVLLEIIDWLPPASLCDKFGNDWNRFRKVQMISAVQNFYRNKSSKTIFH